MASFKVKGADETVENVEIFGETRKVGDIIELDAELAEVAELVAEGKLEAVEGGETPAGDVTPPAGDVAGAQTTGDAPVGDVAGTDAPAGDNGAVAGGAVA